ncbi:unnamed protein product [Victoria cruziana]
MAVHDEDNLGFKKYLRGNNTKLQVIKDKKLRGQLSAREELYGKTATVAAKVDKWLMPCEGGYLEAEGLEKTWNIKQEAILREVYVLSSRKAFDIVLPGFGQYTLDYSLNGRHMVIAGRKGHLAIIETKTMGLKKEFQVRETVRDVAFSPIMNTFAAAQKKYAYIYDMHGTELHCLKERVSPLKLQFLTNHLILATINKFGHLHFQDISTGEMVGHHRTGLGRCDVMKVNPFNGVIGLGHTCGKVTMWNPNNGTPLVKMLCHHGPVSSIAFHRGGHLMATAGMDRKIKLWDLRKFENLFTYSGHAKTMDFSQKGLLALAGGSLVQIWRDEVGNQDYRFYMKHGMVKGFQVGDLLFQPYEDVLGLGHSMGVSSILVPGSGEPNFDTFVANPFETTRQQREREVHQLLDKLQPEMIMLNPTKIGSIKRKRKGGHQGFNKQELEAEMAEAVAAAKSMPRSKKTKGRSKPSKVEKKKKEAISDAKRPFLEKHVEKDRSKKQKTEKKQMDLPVALQRFVLK